MALRTCVSSGGEFVYGIHKSRFTVKNLRDGAEVSTLGKLGDGRIIDNAPNFPDGDVDESHTYDVYEIPNAFPFKGSTFISGHFADRNARHPDRIAIPAPADVSLAKAIQQWSGNDELTEMQLTDLYKRLPEPLQLAIATTSTDPIELARMAGLTCRFVRDETNGQPVGLVYGDSDRGTPIPIIDNQMLYKALANNPHLPNPFKRAMVLTPGAQGHSPIVGEYATRNESAHVFEYLRRNSYIPWGHYAANMADDAIRYHIDDLTQTDMAGMRHLYYQRTYVRLAQELGLPVPSENTSIKTRELEFLRKTVHAAVQTRPSDAPLRFTNTLWGWNFGFDFAPTGYRLNGSHQQIHQQYAMIPTTVPARKSRGNTGDSFPAFTCGNLVGDFVREFREKTGESFFDCYIRAIRGNRRTDGKDGGESRLLVHEDDRVMLFVPKAQTSQWELQLMTRESVGNILETDTETRNALDRAMLIAVKVLSAMGAKLITTIEYAKGFDNADRDQRLLYCFLPRLPASPGAFSEAQLRWINRHYPEDFAAACRHHLTTVKRRTSNIERPTSNSE